tara:strand:+ start:188 stop:733 length:546 start_codon:yes stop_codon:yes gene_type:complete
MDKNRTRATATDKDEQNRTSKKPRKQQNNTGSAGTDAMEIEELDQSSDDAITIPLIPLNHDEVVWALLRIVRIIEDASETFASGGSHAAEAAISLAYKGCKQFPQNITWSQYVNCGSISEFGIEDVLLLLANKILINWKPAQVRQTMKDTQVRNNGALFAEHTVLIDKAIALAKKNKSYGR